MSTISTVPPLLEIAVGETRIWPLDVSTTLSAAGLTGLATPVVSVINTLTNTVVGGGTSAVSVLGNVITATVNGAVLTINTPYRLLWSAVSQGQTITWVTQLNVVA
jgi:hypothetical protein